MAANCVSDITIESTEQNVPNESEEESQPSLFFEILLQLEQSRNESISSRVNLVINGWSVLVSEALSLPEVSEAFYSLFRETAHTVFKSKWDSVDESLKHRLITILQEGGQKLSNLVDGAFHLSAALVDTARNPWGEHVLRRLLKGEIVPSDDVAKQYLLSQPKLLLLAQVEFLASAGHEDAALRLCQGCLRSHWPQNMNSKGHCNKEGDYPPDGGGGDYGGGVMDSPCSGGKDVVGTKQAFWIWMLRILHRKQQLHELVKETSQCMCHDGVQLIHRIKDGCLKDSVELAETLTHLFLVRDLLYPSSYCCTKELMTLWCGFQVCQQKPLQDISAAAHKLLVLHASTSAHFYLFVDILWKHFGSELLPLYLEMYIRGLTADLNFLEEARYDEDEGRVLELKCHIASVFSRLATLFFHSQKELARECVISAFSMEPTHERLQLLRQLTELISLKKMAAGVTSNKTPGTQWQVVNHSIGDQLDGQDAGMVLNYPRKECLCGRQCSSPTEEIEFLKSLESNQSIESFCHPVIDAKVDGVSDELLKDFATVLECMRCTLLCGKDKWEDMLENCEEYLETALAMKTMMQYNNAYDSADSETDSPSEDEEISQLIPFAKNAVQVADPSTHQEEMPVRVLRGVRMVDQTIQTSPVPPEALYSSLHISKKKKTTKHNRKSRQSKEKMHKKSRNSGEDGGSIKDRAHKKKKRRKSKREKDRDLSPEQLTRMLRRSDFHKRRNKKRFKTHESRRESTDSPDHVAPLVEPEDLLDPDELAMITQETALPSLPIPDPRLSPSSKPIVILSDIMSSKKLSSKFKKTVKSKKLNQGKLKSIHMHKALKSALHRVKSSSKKRNLKKLVRRKVPFNELHKSERRSSALNPTLTCLPHHDETSTTTSSSTSSNSTSDSDRNAVHVPVDVPPPSISLPSTEPQTSIMDENVTSPIIPLQFPQQEDIVNPIINQSPALTNLTGKEQIQLLNQVLQTSPQLSVPPSKPIPSVTNASLSEINMTETIPPSLQQPQVHHQLHPPLQQPSQQILEPQPPPQLPQQQQMPHVHEPMQLQQQTQQQMPQVHEPMQLQQQTQQQMQLQQQTHQQMQLQQAQQKLQPQSQHLSPLVPSASAQPETCSISQPPSSSASVTSMPADGASPKDIPQRLPNPPLSFLPVNLQLTGGGGTTTPLQAIFVPSGASLNPTCVQNTARTPDTGNQTLKITILKANPSSVKGPASTQQGAGAGSVTNRIPIYANAQQGGASSNASGNISNNPLTPLGISNVGGTGVIAGKLVLPLSALNSIRSLLNAANVGGGQTQQPQSNAGSAQGVSNQPSATPSSGSRVIILKAPVNPNTAAVSGTSGSAPQRQPCPVVGAAQPTPADASKNGKVRKRLWTTVRNTHGSWEWRKIGSKGSLEFTKQKMQRNLVRQVCANVQGTTGTVPAVQCVGGMVLTGVSPCKHSSLAHVANTSNAVTIGGAGPTLSAASVTIPRGVQNNLGNASASIQFSGSLTNASPLQASANGVPLSTASNIAEISCGSSGSLVQNQSSDVMPGEPSCTSNAGQIQVGVVPQGASSTKGKKSTAKSLKGDMQTPKTANKPKKKKSLGKIILQPNQQQPMQQAMTGICPSGGNVVSVSTTQIVQPSDSVVVFQPQQQTLQSVSQPFQVMQTENNIVCQQPCNANSVSTVLWTSANSGSVTTTPILQQTNPTLLQQTAAPVLQQATTPILQSTPAVIAQTPSLSNQVTTSVVNLTPVVTAVSLAPTVLQQVPVQSIHLQSVSSQLPVHQVMVPSTATEANISQLQALVGAQDRHLQTPHPVDPNVQSRSLSSISDAVRVSLMMTDENSGGVENQMASSYHSYPQGNAAVFSHDGANTVPSNTTGEDQNVSSNQVMLSHTFQMAQVNLTTTGMESSGISTFTSQACVASSTSTAWSTSEPAASITIADGGKQNPLADTKEKPKKKKKPKDPNDPNNSEQKKKKKKVDIDPNTGEEVPQRWWCDPCNRGFFSAYNLRRHQKNVHKVDCPSPRGSSEVMLSPRLSADSQFSPPPDPSQALATTVAAVASPEAPSTVTEQHLPSTTSSTVYTVSSEVSSSISCPPPSSIVTTQLAFAECPSTPFSSTSITNQQTVPSQVVSIPCAGPPVQTLQPEVNYVPVTKTNAIMVQTTETSAPLVSAEASQQNFQSSFYSFVTSLTPTDGSSAAKAEEKPQEQQPVERRQSLDDIEQMLLEDVAWSSQGQDQPASKPQCTLPYEPEQTVATQVAQTTDLLPANVCNLNTSLVDTFVSGQENTGSSPPVFVSTSTAALIQNANRVNLCSDFQNHYKEDNEPGEASNGVIVSECKETQVDSESFEQFSSNVENGCENFENTVEESTLNIGGKSYVCKESQTVGEIGDFGFDDVPDEMIRENVENNNSDGKEGLEQVLCDMHESYKEVKTVTGSIANKVGVDSSIPKEKSQVDHTADSFSLTSNNLMLSSNINTQISSSQTAGEGIAVIEKSAQGMFPVSQGDSSSCHIAQLCEKTNTEGIIEDDLCQNLVSTSSSQTSLTTASTADVLNHSCTSSVNCEVQATETVNDFTVQNVPEENNLTFCVSKETQVDEILTDQCDDENGIDGIPDIKEQNSMSSVQIDTADTSCNMVVSEKSSFVSQHSDNTHNEGSSCQNLGENTGSVFHGSVTGNGEYDTNTLSPSTENEPRLLYSSDQANADVLITTNARVNAEEACTNHILTLSSHDTASSDKEMISFSIPNNPDVNNDTCQSISGESSISAGNRSNDSEFEFSLQVVSAQQKNKATEDFVASNSEDSIRLDDESLSQGTITRGRTRHRESMRKRNCPCCDDTSPKSVKKCRSNSSESGSTSADDKGHSKHGVSTRMSQKKP